MKAIAITAAALGIAALGSWSPAANAETCFREVVAGPSGHREMVRGCYTRERIATRAPRRTVTTRTVTRDYYTVERPYTTTVTRDYVSEPVSRVYDEDIYYGSSMPAPGPGPRPYWWGDY